MMEHTSQALWAVLTQCLPDGEPLVCSDTHSLLDSLHSTAQTEQDWPVNHTMYLGVL